MEKWGFGMAPLKLKTARKNRDALLVVQKLLQMKPVRIDIAVEAISTTKGLFNRVIRQDQWDWFMINMYFDYPPIPTISRIVGNLTNLRKSIIADSGNDSDTAILNLHRLGLSTYIDNYLNFSISVEGAVQYIYILSTRETKEILKIGRTTRNVESRVKEINSATGILFPLSARKVYKVTDSVLAENIIHQALDSYRIRTDREFFQLPFKDADEIINRVLLANNLHFYPDPLQ